MAEFLVMAAERTHSDPEKDRRGVHKKGDIVVVMPDDHAWGAMEGPPNFVVVRCPEVTVEQVRDRMQPWRYSIAFAVVASDLSIDGFRVDATNQTRSPSGGASITLAQIQAYLDSWGAVYVSNTATSVRFDIQIYTAATSQGFWDARIDSMIFNEVSYDQGTGVHVIDVDYSAHPRYIEAAAQFEAGIPSFITRTGATYISHGSGVARFSVQRLDVRNRFRDQLTEKLGTYRRHRYHFTEAQVDTVLAGTGSITVTAAQLTAAVQDRTAE